MRMLHIDFWTDSWIHEQTGQQTDEQKHLQICKNTNKNIHKMT